MIARESQTQPDDWLTKEQAADYLAISPKTLQRMASAGSVPHYRIGRSLRLRRSDLDLYIAAARVGRTPVEQLQAESAQSAWPGPPASTSAEVPLGEQAQAAGIQAIFKTRVEDPAYRVAISRALDEVADGDRVRMMGNSLRSWLGGQPDLMLFLPMWAALRRDVRFDLLLLDPHSPAAQARAEVVEGTSYDSDRDRYYDSHLYIDIVAVAQQLLDPSPQWMPDPALRARLANRSQVSVRFSATAPTKHMICTSRLCFEESYHIGGDSEIEQALLARGIPSQHCFGGFVPVFAYSRSHLAGRLLVSHFDHSWEAAEGRTLDDVLAEAGAVRERRATVHAS